MRAIGLALCLVILLPSATAHALENLPLPSSNMDFSLDGYLYPVAFGIAVGLPAMVVFAIAEIGLAELERRPPTAFSVAEIVFGGVMVACGGAMLGTAAAEGQPDSRRDRMAFSAIPFAVGAAFAGRGLWQLLADSDATDEASTIVEPNLMVSGDGAMMSLSLRW